MDQAQRGAWQRLWHSGGGRALFGFLLLQLGYWGWLYPALTVPVGSVERLPVGQAEAADVPDLQRLDWTQLKFEPVELPWRDCCEPGYRVLRLRFELAAVPAEGLAIVPIVGADNYRLWLNDTLLLDEGRFQLPEITYHGNVRAVFRLPAGLLQTGSNQIGLALVRDGGSPNFIVAAPVIGDYATLRQAYAVRSFVLNDYNTISYAMGLCLTLLSLIVWLRGGRPALLGWLTLLAASWSLRLLYYDLADPPWRGATRMALLYAMVNLLPVAWLNLANHWDGRPWRRVASISLLSYGLLQALVTAILQWRWFDHIDTADMLSMAFGLLLALLTMLRFLPQLRQLPVERAAEYAVLGMCLSLLAVSAWNSLNGGGPDHVNLAMPALLLGLMAAFLARNIRLFRSSEQLNQVLGERLAEREQALHAAHQRERQLVRRQAHEEERQRILRDMHDGLGSQLMSLLLAARRGQCDPPEMADGLQAVIDEMRLLIDSMDSVSESLPAALQTLHERTRQRLAPLGVHLDWQQQGDLRWNGHGPREVLQVFRILQEAISNALRHSGSERIEVRIERLDDGRLQVQVRDHGTGLPATLKPGRGLANLRARAAQLGGEIEFLSTPQGLTVSLQLPADREAAT